MGNPKVPSSCILHVNGRISVQPTSMSLIREVHLPIDIETSTPSKQPNPQKYQKHQTQKYHKRKPSNPLSLRHPLHSSHRPIQIHICIRKILILTINIPPNIEQGLP